MALASEWVFVLFARDMYMFSLILCIRIHIFPHEVLGSHSGEY